MFVATLLVFITKQIPSKVCVIALLEYIAVTVLLEYLDPFIIVIITALQWPA